MTRSERIRALAAARMCRWDYFGKDDPWIRQSAERNLAEASLIIDAIDALPVPGEERKSVHNDDCTECGGKLTWSSEKQPTGAPSAAPERRAND